MALRAAAAVVDKSPELLDRRTAVHVHLRAVAACQASGLHSRPPLGRQMREHAPVLAVRSMWQALSAWSTDLGQRDSLLSDSRQWRTAVEQSLVKPPPRSLPRPPRIWVIHSTQACQVSACQNSREAPNSAVRCLPPQTAGTELHARVVAAVRSVRMTMQMDRLHAPMASEFNTIARLATPQYAGSSCVLNTSMRLKKLVAVPSARASAKTSFPASCSADAQ